ncbi:MAG: hypothetical protein WBE46_06380 [Dehalococcoidia bacterium]
MGADNGTTWNNSCVDCGTIKVTHGLELPGQCRCGCWRWLCHKLDGTFKAEKAGDKPLEAMIGHPDNLSQGFEVGGNSGLPNRAEKGKPGPKPKPLEDIVSELASQGLSSRVIAARLNEQGVSVSYRTVLRRLQRVLLQ